MNAYTESALNFIENAKHSIARHAHGHFIAAMRVGYASKPVKGTIAELPGSKTIEYIHDKWRVLDTYLVTPQSEYSGGSTVVWYGPVPVWMMQYIGHYRKEAIPCLKAALARSYTEGKFFGGRGPECFRYKGYTYINNVVRNGFQSHAWGSEAVYRNSDNAMVGYHRYQSTYMVA